MSDDLQDVINAVGDLPPMPAVALKVMELIQDPATTADQLARAISLDPAVAARVLKIANSSYYSLTRQVKTVEHAIMILGEKTLKSLVLAASLKGVNRNIGLMEKMLWEDSIGCAIGARIVCRYRKAGDPEEAFLGGLFRHIGKLVLNNSFPEEFREMVQRAYNGEALMNQLEREYFPFSHSVVGAAVLKKWKMSDNLIRLVQHHSDLFLVMETDPVQQQLTASVNLADKLCRVLGIGQRAPEKDLVVLETAGAKVLKMTRDEIDEVTENFRTVFEADKEVFLA